MNILQQTKEKDMNNYFSKIKDYLLELEYNILSEDKAEELVIVENQNAGITNLIIDCEEPILIVELYLFDLNKEDVNIYKEFLKMNREIIHGAIALDETGTKVLFRDTLQIENLDLNELQGTLNSLEVFLSENANKLVDFSKN